MKPPDGPPTAEVRRRLLPFFRARKRPLPWRETLDPYAIWVSEVMLQQTRVQTVLPYYRAWMARFPDVETLAAAEMDDVLNVWKGLGYYSRARNLHRAAAVVCERFGGALPDRLDELRALPGVGAYTAGAVASIAFGVRAPAVDGNVRRVLSRVWDLDRPGAKTLRAIAQALVDCRRPGDVNQSLMELGATVCLPRAPECAACPLAVLCLARERGTIEERPGKGPKRQVPAMRLGVAVVVRGGGEVLIVRRPMNGLLGGMWEFPARELEEAGPEEAEARRAALRLGAAVVGPGQALEPVRHRFTHLAATYVPFVFRVEEGEVTLDGSGEDAPDDPPEHRWVPLDDLGEVPLPVAQQRILALARARVLPGSGRRHRG